MADFVFNISLGRVAEKCVDDVNQLLVMLLKAAEADATYRDRDTVTAVLAEAGTTEAVFTNYARKTALTATTPVDDTNDRVDIDIPDQTWTAAGNGANDTLTDLIVAYEEDVGTPADTDRKPMTSHDFAVTTDGSDLTVQFNSSGFYRAQPL